jgi:hypothetical protein
MSLVCEELATETVHALNKKLTRLPDNHPFKKDLEKGNIQIWKDGDAAVFFSQLGFYFVRIATDLESAVAAELKTVQRDYLCSAFSIDGGDELVRQLLDRFQENHGAKMAKMIDHIVLTFRGQRLMLVKFPSCVVRHMLAPSGGVLRSEFSGPVESLKSIQVLEKMATLPEEGKIGVFATEYKEHQYMLARSIHNALLREVVAKPGLGITLHRIAVWDS